MQTGLGIPKLVDAADQSSSFVRFIAKRGFLLSRGHRADLATTVRVSLPGLLELAIFGGVDA